MLYLQLYFALKSFNILLEGYLWITKTFGKKNKRASQIPKFYSGEIG